MREGDERGNEGTDGMSEGNLGLRALLRFNKSKLFEPANNGAKRGRGLS